MQAKLCPVHGVDSIANEHCPDMKAIKRYAQNFRKNKTFWFYCKEVFGSSSVSGVNNIASAKSCERRGLWMFIFLVSLTGFFYQTGSFIVQYNEHQSIVQVEVHNEGTLVFPAVTICNSNRIKKTEFCNFFREYCPKNLDNMESLTEKQIKDLQLTFLREGKSGLRKALGHKKEDMLVSCFFTGVPSIEGNECLGRFQEFYDPDLGNCYTFSPIFEKGETLNATDADVWRKLSDLVLVVNVEAKEYLEPDRDDSILITFHSPDDYPDPFSDGAEIKSGHSYNLGLKKATVEMLPAPYSSNCTNYDELPWERLHDRTLSTRMCTAECSQNFQLRECNYVTLELSLFFDLLPWSGEIMNADRLQCAERVSNATQEFCRSLCRVPCKQSNYDVTMDSSAWPRRAKVSEEAELGIWKKRHFRDITNNLARVRIYFLSMEHTILKHSPKYQPLELFSHVGGYVGIWLGISLLALCEFIEGVIMVTSFALANRKKRKQIEQFQNSKLFIPISKSRTYE